MSSRRAHAAVMSVVLALVLNGSASAFQDEEWTLLDPVEVKSLGGATVTRLDDGSHHVTGHNPPTDTYLVRIESKLTDITGFKLEVMPPPKGGKVGRSRNGNFVLTTFSVAAAPRSQPKRARAVTLSRALANHSQARWRVDGAIDSNPKTGWAILPQVEQTNVAIFETKRKTGFRAGTIFEVVLDFQFGDRHTANRFRLSATRAKRPLKAPAGPDHDEWIKIQRKMKTALDDGVDALIGCQELDGSWKYHMNGYPCGQTALTLYTLMKCGVSKHHPAVQRGVEFIRTNPPKKTYSHAVVILALLEIDAPAYKGWIKKLVKDLIDWQRGGWAYPHGAVDLSNTQYAALALRNAAQKGHKVPRKVWESLVKQTLRHQKEGKGAYSGAGFAYRPGGKVTSSMTAAGVSILAICQEQMSTKRHDIIVGWKRGVDWLAKNFTVSTNLDENGGGGDRWLFYYLYGLERVGGLLGLDEIGDHDWYKLGAKYLIGAQKGDGMWKASGGEGQPNTCFALLFLVKATSSSSRVVGEDVYGVNDPLADVSLRASGDTPLTIWISRFGDDVRGRLGWLEDEGRGLRVQRVEYHWSAEKSMKEPTLLSTIKGDPSKGSDRNRFAMQHQFVKPGSYWLQARVWVVPPKGTIADEKTWKKIESQPLRVRIDRALDEKLIAYAGDHARNVLAGQQITVKASSVHGGQYKAQFVVDNSQGHAWLSKNDDPLPTIRLVLTEPVRADTILLSHPRVNDGKRNRAKRVHVRFNRRKSHVVIDLIEDLGEKTVHKLKRPIVVRQLELTVVEVFELDKTRTGVGFAEVELQMNRGR